MTQPEKTPQPLSATSDGFDTPRHVAIIMDGNGRWAAARGLPRVEGHRRGVEALRNLLYPESPTVLPLPASIAALALFTMILFALCFFRVNRRSTRPAA